MKSLLAVGLLCGVLFAGDKDRLALELYDMGAVKFGDFVLKSGARSPVYIDLRVAISYPEVLKEMARCIDVECDLVCGVPYAAVPLATAVSLETGVPLVMVRKEAKGHGTKRRVEGVFTEGQRCLVLDDVITSGGSVLETIEALENEGLIAEDVAVVVDRGQGGAKALGKRRLKALFTMRELVAILGDVMGEEKRQVVESYLRKGECQNTAARKLLDIIEEKGSHLAVAADVSRCSDLLEMAERVGPYICLLKTHIDLLEDFTPEVTAELKEIAARHRFLICEDRKFADIGAVAKEQCGKGLYRIGDWADFVTVHAIAGEAAVSAIEGPAVLLIAQMSSAGNLITDLYTQSTVELARRRPDKVAGFICQEKIAGGEFLYLTPGVQLGVAGDGLGQQYRTPQAALQAGSDVVIVGRGITQAPDVALAARVYQENTK